MIKEKQIRILEKAQVLPILAIAMIVMVMFAALIIDGGSIMVNRREAQAAADAGAMAGARELCYPTGAEPLDVAEYYAGVNGADPANAQYVDGNIAVEATVSNDSFFSKIFGVDTLTAVADAEAGCFAPLGNYLMPIGWSCRPSLGGEEIFDPDLDCLMMALDWDDLLRPLVEGEKTSIKIPGNDGEFDDFVMDGDNIVENTLRTPPKQIYIVMDNVSTADDTFCKEDLGDCDDPIPEDPVKCAVAITCDLDGDGKSDIQGSGNRGWIDLDGGGGGNLATIVENGLDFPVSPHTWMAGKSGTDKSVFKAIQNYRVGEVVLIPVFNAICDDRTPLDNPTCMEEAHAPPRPPEPTPPSGDIDLDDQKPKFHIITFTPFYISCVHENKNDSCPGFDLAVDMNPDPDKEGKSLIKENTASVEGYFLKNVELPLDLENHCDINLGNCVVSLTK